MSFENDNNDNTQELHEPIARTIERIVSGDTRHLQKNLMPLQLSGQDEILRHYTLGGPATDRDVRMYLELADLEHLVNIAKAAKTKRAVLPRAGITVVVRRSRDGHIYETMHLESLQPVPEGLPTTLSSTLPIQQINQWARAGLVKIK